VAGLSHKPVLLAEVLAYLAPRPGGRYVDVTVGGGGHAAAVLEAAPGASLLGIDRDPAALAAAGDRLGERAILAHGRMSELGAILAAQGWGPVDGIVADLGVSSPQLDAAERGFSFTRPGPLDMRMDPTAGETAAELAARLPVVELERILRDYGEERFAGRIARAVHAAARAGELATTEDLARLVTGAMPPQALRREAGRIHPATRTFQALRIAVNDELGELAALLAAFPDLLAPEGRLVVIAFHSLEDRAVKERIRELEWTSRLPADLAVLAGERTRPVVCSLTRKPVVAGEAEVQENPRARSAKLRACQRCPHD
jgi:16S rRNA (cytosine1402-N4)-methyltransferase